MPRSALLRSLIRTGCASVVSDKLLNRLSESAHRLRTQTSAGAWAQWEAKDVPALVTRWDADLWVLSQLFTAAIEPAVARRRAAVGLPKWGGGHYPLRHFVTRLCRPSVAAETDVAAGWSSVAILEALEANGIGTCHSSDFPYFRLPGPEKLVGLLIEERLRTRWHLHIRGSKPNLPEIVATLDHVDLVHDDSDKSVRGRRRALQQVLPNLSPSAVVIMDDVLDNLHFRDLVTEQQWDYGIAPLAGKFAGLMGPGFGALNAESSAGGSG